MGTADDVTDATARDHIILARMRSDAECLCRTQDPLLAGQYRHLLGRIAALLELTEPTDAGTGA